jgi:hypothetical protein
LRQDLHRAEAILAALGAQRSERFERADIEFVRVRLQSHVAASQGDRRRFPPRVPGLSSKIRRKASNEALVHYMDITFV